MEPWRDRFRGRYRELRDQEGLTQEQLAERLGITQGTVAHWLNGRRSPKSLEAYESLASALRVHPAWLLYGIGEEDGDVLRAAQRLRSMPPELRDAIVSVILAS